MVLQPCIVKKNFFILSVGWKINTADCLHLAAKKNGITNDLWINLGNNMMLDCLIIGDSIAVGVKEFKPKCVAFAQGGINSWQWNQKYIVGDRGALPGSEVAIISLGSNDHKGVKTREEITKARAAVQAKRVYWILPYSNLPASGVDIKHIQAVVQEVAASHGDIVLPITKISPDKLHPSRDGYKELAEQAK